MTAGDPGPGAGSSTILVVEDTRLLRNQCRGWLEQRGYRVEVAGDTADAERVLAAAPIDIVLLDLGLPDANGMDLMADIKARDATCEVIVMTGQATVENAVTAMRLGAADFVTKPIDFDLLERSLRIATRVQRLSGENRSLRAQVETAPGDTGVVGESPPMRELMRVVRKIAASGETCLIVGESGTGKEVVARALHRLSDRRDGPFTPVNCGAISESLIESELFGHVKGAFSGAGQARNGLLRESHGGTLLLDEIGDMPLPMQVKLLRAIEHREVVPVGADRAVPVDLRVVAATNVDLPAAVAAGRFREDLYYRLNVLQVAIPPLRDRAGDIPLLARSVLAAEEPPVQLSAEALAVLEAWSWPGNVRELINVVRRACVISDGVIRPEHLPRRLLDSAGAGSGAAPAPVEDLVVRPLEEVERTAVVQALGSFGGDRARTAKALGIARTTLYRKLKRWGFDDDASVPS